MAIGNERPIEVRVAIPEIERSDFVGEERKRPNSTWEKDSMAIDDGNPEGSDFINREREKLKSAFAKEQVQREKDLYETAEPSSIQRVPRSLIERKSEFKNSFEPRAVTIGPFHRGNPMLEEAEETKRLFAALFADENKTSDDLLHRKILADMQALRACYNPKDIESYNDLELSWIFFVDGCAVLYAIRDLGSPFRRYKDKVSPFFYVDLLLLENQLPYRVLHILIDSTSNNQTWKDAIDNFICEMAMKVIVGAHAKEVSSGDPHRHLLHKFQRHLVGGEREKGGSSYVGRMLLWTGGMARDKKTVSGAKNLLDSGISLRSNAGKVSLRNISFHCKFPAILKMPILHIDDSTTCLFLNLVALECCPGFSGTTVRSYLGFIAYLIQTPEDVKQLRVRGMLKHHLKSDDDVTALFRQGNDLSLGPEIRRFVIKNIQRYCNSWLVNYFSSQWSFVTFVGAMGGLVMTLVQTYININKYLEGERKTD